MSGGVLLVASRCCDQCLFGANKIVSDTRKRSILRDCVKQDKHFVCHKSSIRDEDEGMVCRGFFEAYPGVGQLVRVAKRLDAVSFADPETGEVIP